MIIKAMVEDEELKEDVKKMDEWVLPTIREIVE